MKKTKPKIPPPKLTPEIIDACLRRGARDAKALEKRLRHMNVLTERQRNLVLD